MILDQNEMAAEYIKGFEDKSRIYFIEHNLSTFDGTKGKKVPFIIFPRQKVFLKTIAKTRNVIAVKHRQCGITTISSAYVAGQCVFADENAPETILCIANKLEQANQIIVKIREFLTQVPRWYWGEDYYSPDPKSDKNTKSIFLKDSKSELELFNGCHIYARSSGENSSRGISSVSLLLLDECAFIENARAVYASCAATMAANPNSKCVMVSTPNGHDELYYQTYKQALAHENNFTAVEFQWYQDLRFNKNLKWIKKDKKTGENKEIKEPVLDETGTIKYDEEHWADMVRKGWKPRSPWYENMCKTFNNDSIKIAQELDVSFLGSANNVVSPEFIDMQNTMNVREPLADFKDPMNDDTWFWKKPIKGHRYICACLPEGEKVVTNRGLVNVENVNSDDLLVTKEGEYTKIKYRKYRDVKEEKIYEIIPYGYHKGVKFTGNHPIFASKENIFKSVYLGNGKCRRIIKHDFKFINAENISVGDYLVFPNYYDSNELTESELNKKWEKYNYHFNNQYNQTISSPFLNEDFWWYCGMWLAEGYVQTKKANIVITTVHNSNEIEYHKKIVSIAKDIFKRSASIRMDKEWNSCKITFTCKQIGCFLTDTFGKYAYGKYISEWVKHLPKRLKLKLVEGYLNGDGSFINTKTVRISATSISSTLLEDIRDILYSLGIVSRMSLAQKEGETIIDGRKVHARESYHLDINAYNAQKLFNLLELPIDLHLSRSECKRTSYISDDNKKIYIKVKAINISEYNGKVYNFETESDSHTYVVPGMSVHNCDPSRGISADRTAIEIIDMDGVDENGLPIIEQVGEYLGKKLGDDIGGMCVQYCQLYNNAYFVADATGGNADALLLTMINMGYKNLYYEDNNQKTYTVQNAVNKDNEYINRLPGFHFQGTRYAVLSTFAGMVRSNEFKIRSHRVTNELDTWIFDGTTGRMDHQDGAHDDTICALAMGLFVMKYTYNKILEKKEKDKAILNAYTMNTFNNVKKDSSYDDKAITPKNGLPFYNERTLRKVMPNQDGNYLWLFAGYR